MNRAIAGIAPYDRDPATDDEHQQPARPDGGPETAARARFDPAAGRHVDGPGQPPVRRVGGPAQRHPAPGARLGDRVEQVRVERVPVPDAALAIGPHGVLPGRQLRDAERAVGSGQDRLVEIAPPPAARGMCTAAGRARCIRLARRGHERIRDGYPRGIHNHAPPRCDSMTTCCWYCAGSG